MEEPMAFRSIEGVAINHDVNHLTVLSWDQMQPFMNDTFDWPQWDALNVSDSGVIEYFQSMVSLGDPVGLNLEFDSDPMTPPATETPEDPAMPPMDDHEGGGQTPNVDASLELVAATTGVSVLVDPATGLAYVQDQGGQPILISRSDDYWEGDVPLTRGDATIMAAARDDLGRLRVLDGGGLDVYAWILSEDGFFIGQDGPSDSTIADKEALFQMDIDGDGVVGPMDNTASPSDPGMPPMDDPEDHEDHDDGSHDHMAPPESSGDYVDITHWGTFHGSNHNSEHNELVGAERPSPPRHTTPTTTCARSSDSRR